MPKERTKRTHDNIALANAGATAEATPVQSARKSPKKKKRQGGKATPPTGNAKAKTPTSVGSDVKFLPNARLEKYRQAAEKKLASKPCVGNELKERKARTMVEENSNLMHMEVRNGMWPWLSDVSLADDGNIYFYRNQMNHNAISPDLSNEIANNFLGNPLRADLKGKVHAQDMGTDMACFLTHNSKVSVKRNARNFLQFVKTFLV